MPEDSPQPVPNRWKTNQVYAMAAFCLVLGLALGYLFRGSASPAASKATPPANQQNASMSAPQMPTLDQMKQMAEKQAEPLLAQTQKDPRNAELLAKVGRIYESTHQFKEAAQYYGKSLEIDPKNVVLRNEMAACLYYTGDADGAAAQFEQALKYDSKNANSLFNLGMIRWQAKKDSQGAISAWKQLLNTNPQLEAQKKDQVRKLIADASQGTASPDLSNKLKEQ